MKENNKLLADFLGLETTVHNGNLFLTQDGLLDLQYDEIWNPDTNWNQLMQVVHKIRSIDFCTDFNININGDCKIECHFDMEFETYCDNKINTQLAVYYCCVSFVKWYNENINGKNFN